MINFPQRNWTDYGGEVRGVVNRMTNKPILNTSKLHTNDN